MPMKTTKEELEALLYQTRIKIEENQKDEMLKRLNKDLEFIEELFTVNVDNIEPLYNVIDCHSIVCGRRVHGPGGISDILTQI